jgi:hypothetical protein
MEFERFAYGLSMQGRLRGTGRGRPWIGLVDVVGAGDGRLQGCFRAVSRVFCGSWVKGVRP